MILAHLLTTLAKLLGAGGARAVVADSLLMKQQLIVINRSRRRAANLTPVDRMLFGFWSLFLNPRRIQRAAVIIRPTTLLKFHDMLKKRKCRLLYSSGSMGPSIFFSASSTKQRERAFLLGLLNEGQDNACRVPSNLGMNAEAVQAKVMELFPDIGRRNQC